MVKISQAIDSLIGAFSPARQLAREETRNQVQRQRMYAAAKSGRLTGGWRPVDQNVNDLIASSSPAVRAKVRQLVRDFPYFASAVDNLVNLVVGDGIKFQARVRSGDQLDKKTNQKIEDIWKRWCDEADVSGRLHFDEMCGLAKRQDLEAGEYLFVKVKPRGSRFLPYALQAIEPDRISDLGARTNKSAALHQGVEYDPQTGEVLAYHVEDEAGGNSKRIPAKNVIHDFRYLRPGQLRGITRFAPAVLTAYDLGEYMDAEIDASKAASKYLAFITTQDPAGMQMGRVETEQETGQKVEEMENAIIEYLRPGEMVNIAKSDRPGSQFDPFVKLILRMIAVTIGLPYEILSGDYQGLNYTTLRGVRNDLVRHISPQQKQMIRHMCQPTFRDVLDTAYLSRKIDLPGYARDPYQYQKSSWIPPGVPSPDPLKEGKAYIDQIKNNLRSPQEATAERGRDFEDGLDELAEARKMAIDRGLAAEDVSTAVASNPAALDGQN
jgi:lambda family phage portal protein